MLTFSQVSSSGFTFTDERGNSDSVSQSYNNKTGDAHLFYKNNTLYEIATDRVLQHTDKSCTFIATQPLAAWVINHELNSSTVVLATLPNGTVVYPTKVIETTFNTTTIVFSTPILGRATVRPT